MPRFLKSDQFWYGVVAGLIVGPWVLGKLEPELRKMQQR
jgi:hypothetical protein